jgi:hypothetical protein
MDDFEIANERLAQTTRTLRLLNFRLIQLRHTNDQLLAGLQDLIAQASPPPDGDAPPTPLKKDPSS